MPSRFWYSAYPQLTTDRIRTNAAIRHGFASASTEGQAAKWLALFGYAAPENVEKDEICALAFGGLPFFRFAHCLIVQFGEMRKAQAWLRSIQDNLSYGEHAALEKQALVTAFTAEGLRQPIWTKPRSPRSQRVPGRHVGGTAGARARRRGNTQLAGVARRARRSTPC